MNGVQIIELHTDQPERFEQLLARWQSTPGELPAPPRVCRDRLDGGHFVLFLDQAPEAPGFGTDDAERPEEPRMQDWAADLVDLLDSRPRFLDLDSIPPPR